MKTCDFCKRYMSLHVYRITDFHPWCYAKFLKSWDPKRLGIQINLRRK